MPEIVPTSVLVAQGSSKSTPTAALGRGHHHQSTSSSASSSPLTTSIIHSPSALSSSILLPASRTHSNSPRTRPTPFGQPESMDSSQRTSLYSNPSTMPSALSPPPPTHYLRGRARLSQSQESVKHLRKRSEIYMRANQSPGPADTARRPSNRSRSVAPEEESLLFVTTPTSRHSQRSNSISEWPLALAGQSSAPATTTTNQGRSSFDHGEEKRWSFLQTDPMGKEPLPRRTRHVSKGSLESTVSGGRGSLDLQLTRLETRPRVLSNNSDQLTPKATDYPRQWNDVPLGSRSETDSPLSSTSNLSGYPSTNQSSRPNSNQGHATSSPPSRYTLLPHNSPLSTPISPIVRAHLDMCPHPASSCTCPDQESMRSPFHSAGSLPGSVSPASTPSLPTSTSPSGGVALSEVQKRRRAHAFDHFASYSEALPRPLPTPVQASTGTLGQGGATPIASSNSTTGSASSTSGLSSGSSAEESILESESSSSSLSRLAPVNMDHNTYRQSEYAYSHAMSPQGNGYISPTSSASSFAPSSWLHESVGEHVVQPSRSVPNLSAASSAGAGRLFSLSGSGSGLYKSLTSSIHPRVRKRGASTSTSLSGLASAPSTANSFTVRLSLEDEKQTRNGFEIAKDDEAQFAITRTVSCDDEEEYYAYSECQDCHHHHTMDEEETIEEQGDLKVSVDTKPLKKRRKNTHGLEGWKAKCPICRFMAGMKSILTPSTPTNGTTIDADMSVTSKPQHNAVEQL